MRTKAFHMDSISSQWWAYPYRLIIASACVDSVCGVVLCGLCVMECAMWWAALSTVGASCCCKASLARQAGRESMGSLLLMVLMLNRSGKQSMKHSQGLSFWQMLSPWRSLFTVVWAGSADTWGLIGTSGQLCSTESSERNTHRMLGVIKETRNARYKDEKAPGRCLLPSAALPCFSLLCHQKIICVRRWGCVNVPTCSGVRGDESSSNGCG